MEPNNQNPAGNGVPEARSLEPAPVQPRQPANLRGVMLYAMEAQGQNQPRPVSPMSDERRAYLEQALQSMLLDIKEMLKFSLNILRDKDEITSHAGKDGVSAAVRTAFDNLADFTEDIDGADAFRKAGGFNTFDLLYSVNNPELWVRTNNLLAAVCQNFMEAQDLALDRGLLKTLLDKLRDPETKHKEKFIYALSSCVRGNTDCMRAVLALGGAEALAACLRAGELPPRTEEHPLPIKAACLLHQLTTNFPETKDKLKELNLPQILVSIIDKNIGVSTEHFLNLLLCYVDSKEPDIIKQCKNVDPPLHIAIRNILDSPTVTNNKEQYEEVINYGKEILSVILSDEKPLCECSEEADR